MTIDKYTIDSINDLLVKGIAVNKIARQFSISVGYILFNIDLGVLHNNGKTIPSYYKHINIEKLKEAYIRGDSVLKMSQDFGVSRMVVVKRLKYLGYNIRTGSEANIIRFQNSTIEYRQQITEKAHNATRGIKRSFIKRCENAILCEKTANKSPETYGKLGPGELELFYALRNQQLNPVIQKAFNTYNIDIFVAPNIFIELASCMFKGQIQFRKKFSGDTVKRFRQKAKQITDSNGIFVEVNFRDIDILKIYADDIVAFIDSLRTNPSVSGKYFVVSCYYKIALPARDANKGTFISGPRLKYPFREVKEVDMLSIC